MKAFYITICMTVMLIFCSVAYSWGVIEKGPYLQNVGKYRITIMWESLYTTKSRVDYGITKDYDLFVEKTREVELHEITLRPLRPNTRYYYKVTCGLTTKTGTFKTAPDHNVPFSFVVYGDSRDDPDIHKKITRNILKAKPDFIMHVGDLVNSGKKDYQWESQFFEPLDDVINHIPIFTALGNHEANARNYFDLFSLPNNESWFSFNYSNCHFTVLDTNKDYAKGSNQYKWLKNDLTKASTKWKFVFFHHPPYGSGIHHGSDLKVRNVLTPLFRKHSVDMVFSGHHHIYERSYPIASAFEPKSTPVTYVVTGGGGGSLHKTSGNIWTVLTERINNFCVVNMDGDKLDFKACDIDGKKFDEFSIEKGKGKYQEYTKNAIFYEQIEFERTIPAIVTPPVVLLDSGKTQAQDVVKIKNTFPEAVNFTIIWHNPGNWDVSPRQALIRVDSKKTEQVPFTFRFPDADIWPPPTFSVVYDTGVNSGEIADNYLRVLSFKKLNSGKAGMSVDIDGRLKEEFWKDISPANEFIRADFSGLAKKQTSAKVAYGKDTLYLAVVCQEPESKYLSATVKKRDGDVANDEAVIVSIAPHKGDGMVYQFGVNCNGIKYDAKGGVKEWNGKWESAARINDKDWTVEMAIPYKVLELSSGPKKGETWKVNFSRSTTETPEKSEWSATLGSPLEVKRLGALIMN